MNIPNGRTWNRDTDNDGLYWSEEFKRVYSHFGGVGSIFWSPKNIVATNEVPLLNACLNDGIIYSDYNQNSSRPIMTGWPLLVEELRSRETLLSFDFDRGATSSPFKSNFRITVTTESGAKYGAVDSKTFSVLGQKFLRKGTIGDIEGDTDLAEITGAVGRRFILSGSIQNGNQAVSFYPHRVLGEEKQANHYSYKNAIQIGASEYSGNQGISGFYSGLAYPSFGSTNPKRVFRGFYYYYGGQRVTTQS